MDKFLKNFSLLMSDLGALLLPLALYVHPVIISITAIGLFVGGLLISWYYHRLGIDVDEYVFKVGQPVFVLLYGLVLWYLELPLLTVPLGVMVFIVVIVGIQLFRTYVLGLNEVCRIKNK